MGDGEFVIFAILTRINGDTLTGGGRAALLDAIFVFNLGSNQFDLLARMKTVLHQGVLSVLNTLKRQPKRRTYIKIESVTLRIGVRRFACRTNVTNAIEMSKSNASRCDIAHRFCATICIKIEQMDLFNGPK